MSIDLTLPACTQEDGSDVGQTFPCAWDAHVQGNGQGVSFVMNAPQSWLYEDGTLICGSNLMANDDVTACEPITAPEQAQVLTSTAAPSSPPAELAHTGMDPAGALTAAVLVAVGALCLVMRRRLV